MFSKTIGKELSATCEDVELELLEVLESVDEVELSLLLVIVESLEVLVEFSELSLLLEEEFEVIIKELLQDPSKKLNSVVNNNFLLFIISSLLYRE